MVEYIENASLNKEECMCKNCGIRPIYGWKNMLCRGCALKLGRIAARERRKAGIEEKTKADDDIPEERITYSKRKTPPYVGKRSAFKNRMQSTAHKKHRKKGRKPRPRAKRKSRVIIPRTGRLENSLLRHLIFARKQIAHAVKTTQHPAGLKPTPVMWQCLTEARADMLDGMRELLIKLKEVLNANK